MKAMRVDEEAEIMKAMRVAEEAEIMKAMRMAGWDARQIRAMTYTSWKDGIDIERPSTALIAFAQIIRSGRFRDETR